MARLHPDEAAEREAYAVGRPRTFACPVPACGVPLSMARFLFCRSHWQRLPEGLRVTLWTEWRPGQERGKPAPSPAFAEALAKALEILTA